MKLILALVCFILLAAAASAETYLYMKFNYTLENPDYGNELENIENLKIKVIGTGEKPISLGLLQGNKISPQQEMLMNHTS